MDRAASRLSSLMKTRKEIINEERKIKEMKKNEDFVIQ